MAPRQQTRRANPTAPTYVVRQPFDYAGQSLDRGQLMHMGGHLNDERLIRLGFVRPIEKDDERYECGHCSAVFVGLRERTAHGDKRHAPRPYPLTPEQEDQLAENEDRMLDKVAPLYLDKAQGAAGR